MSSVRKQSTVRSALWAAYGDALGFITELADQRILRQRLSADRVTKLTPWTRRIGGRFGADIELPAGCYSDDTQLRLATSRSIRGTGEFDVEAFSKVELPVWLSYALGAGRGSKLAAGALTRKDARWFSNFYFEDNQSYVSSGGNGAAMRIHPHVWASPSLGDPASYLSDVLRNALSTHGHPRAIVGAVFHALCLGHVMGTQRIITASDLRFFNSWTKKIPSLLQDDTYLRDFWVPKWEELSRTTLQEAFDIVFDELQVEIAKVETWLHGRERSTYEQLVEMLDLKNPATRGAGTQTALAAVALSMLLPKREPEDLLLSVANLLGTDTDSIASMAGALIGAITNYDIPQLPQDSQLIKQDAVRLYQLSQGDSVATFSYPGLIGWVPPKSAVDAVFVEGGKLVISGLGQAEPLTATRPTGISRGDYVYQWVQLPFGQRLFIKRRSDQTLGIKLSMTTSNQLLFDLHPATLQDGTLSNKEVADNVQGIAAAIKSVENECIPGVLNMHDLTNEAIHSGFSPVIIGSHILKLSDSPDGIERVIAYAAIIAKARIARIRREQR